MTLIELVVAIGIFLILAVMIFKATPNLYGSFTKAQCISNMRSLHSAFAAYISEKNHWPPVPTDLSSNDTLYDNYWIGIMRPYTQSEKVWQCPVLAKGHLKNASGDELKVHYLPTEFDATPNGPYRWPRQPWLIEIASAHGQGPLILFPDGSVQALGQLLKNN
ncbi:hypothetical protein TSACC_22357 [Terrimicrobium sacchariphilum]|uniref:Prepilin-type N-terminal cleavage/methylation domain-containing protein n=2 Tax=Terrimicrobium sacchariphilum TaxID=690879 RepID=A0A146GBN1_TERSA|nr:type II secretion system protein [Terrimicrobium sacchariphilum]GAT33936.1 hypothetical protein TSACC_22357 [Terrimicrobium sacchariphilum]